MNKYIENYKNLIFTLAHTEKERKTREKPVIVYDALNCYLPIAVFNTTSSCALFFETSPKTICDNIHRKTLRNHRFLIERIYD